MKESIISKLESLQDRYQEIAGLLAEPDVIADQNQFRKYSMEYAQLEPVVKTFIQFTQTQQDMAMAQELLSDDDASVQEMAHQEITDLNTQQEALELDLQKLLLPKDPLDNSNVFIEIRAGTGGDEAAIFAGDLYRMYCRYAEQKRWSIEAISANEGEHGGYREVVARIVGHGAYSLLKFESGAHRVQRVPETESQGRVHTSAATVAILPEADEIEDIDVNPSDLRIDTFRASGAGGQHVNKTDSAIRITHLPSGVVVGCQDARSQHKNKARAMSLLKARLLAAEQSKQSAEQAAARKILVGSGDRSERIRTYNFPQGRMTDHRINLTLYKLDELMQGNLSPVIDPLINEYQAEQLASLNAS